MIWTELISRFENDSVIVRTYEGRLNSISAKELPCSVLIPTDNNPTGGDYFDTRIDSAVSIFEVVADIFWENLIPGKQILGDDEFADAKEFGQLNMERHIKSIILAPPEHLNNKVIRVTFGRTNYIIGQFEVGSKEYYTNGVEITMRFRYLESY